MFEIISYGSFALNLVLFWYFINSRIESSNIKYAIQRSTNSVEDLIVQRDGALLEIKKIKKLLEKERGLSTLHISKNEEFERQAREAWDRYRKAALLAGNAQMWLMRELERSVFLLNRYRKDRGEEPIKPNPAMQELVDNFKREHVSETTIDGTRGSDDA